MSNAKFEALERRARIVAEANKAATATTDTLMARLASKASVNVALQDSLAAKIEPAASSFAPANRLELKTRIANSALGFELRDVPYAEIGRIVKMQIVQLMDRGELEAFNRSNILAEAYDGTTGDMHPEVRDGQRVMVPGFRFFDDQAEAILGYELYSGVFGPIGVGWGKTMITLAIANKAYQKGLRKILLLVPPEVLDQLATTDIRWCRLRIPLNLPIHIVGGRETLARQALCSSDKKGLYILPYSYLSVKDTTKMLDGIKPQLIICDEAHRLANRDSARTKRLMNYVEHHGPEGVVLSGTITSKSVRDYHHLAKWALKEYNFLPNSKNLADEWGSVIDATATGTYGDDAGTSRGASGPLVPLIRWAQDNFKGETFGEDIPSFRAAYKKRMTTSPGVVSTGDASIGTSLVIANVPVPAFQDAPGWGDLEKLRRQVTDMWMTPNGDEIEHSIHTWKWLNELSLGFYNQLTWPTPEEYARRKSLADKDAIDTLDKTKAHHAAGQVYAKALRKWLQTKSRAGIDTPMLVGMDMARNGDKNVGAELFLLWQDWKAQAFEGMPDRDSKAVRVCPFKITACVDWVRKLMGDEGEVGAIIWAYHQEVGQWAHAELVKAGIFALHCPAGANEAILDPCNSKRIIVASMTSHGTGKNLQHFQHNYFLQWPRQAVAAEQTLGRTHRSGQKADELRIHRNATIEFDHLNFAACLNDSLYIHQTTGNRQKLIYAKYDPLPKIFPSAVLIERGAQARQLSRDQERELKEKFTG